MADSTLAGGARDRRGVRHRPGHDEHLGTEYDEDEDLGEESPDTAKFSELSSRGLWRRTAFACIFFTCLVALYFAIFTFAGALAGLFVLEKVGRSARSASAPAC